MENRIRDGRQAWGRHCDDNNLHHVISDTPLVPGVSWPQESGGPIFIPIRHHSCSFGRFTSFVRTWYYPHNVLRLHDPRFTLIHFRLHFHLVVPGELMHRWNSSTYFDATFPLFGAVRRFWGRAMRIAGHVFFMGERHTRSRRVETVLDDMIIGAEVRRPGLLRMNRISAQTHLQWGPRMDGQLLGISLQWHSEIDEEELPPNDVSVAPLPCTIEHLCEPLLGQVEVPHSPRWTSWGQLTERQRVTAEWERRMSTWGSSADNGAGEEEDVEEGRERGDSSARQCPPAVEDSVREEL